MLGQSLISSSRGVQQGDPLGPAFFALAIQDCIRQSKAQVEAELPGQLDFGVFFLDDGIAAGSAEATAKFTYLLKDGFANLGLDLTFPKCEVIPTAKQNHEVRKELFEDFVWIEDGNLKLLGAASLVLCQVPWFDLTPMAMHAITRTHAPSMRARRNAA